MTIAEIARRAVELPGTALTQRLIAQRFESGVWVERSLVVFLDEAVAAFPDRTAAITVDERGDTVRTLTYAELDALSRQVSAGLLANGVGPGSVVTVMMSNCAEFPAVVYGILRVGATYSGIPITYGAHEIEFMTRRAGADVMIVAGSHAGRDLAGLAAATLADRDEVLVVVVDGPRGHQGMAFTDLIAHGSYAGPAHVDPLAIAQLAFTSGTTDEPKAVMNLHATLDVVVRGWSAHVGPTSYGDPMRNLVMSPVGHATGFMWGVLLTVHLGGTAVYVDRWSPAAGARVISEQRITCMVGSPTFLIDLLRTANLSAASAPDLNLVVVAGAPIPRPLVPEARAALDCDVIPAWGMTEFGVAISGRPALGRRNYETDGTPVAACEIRICDEAGSPLPAGVEGELQIRGAGLFAGYYARPDFTRDAFGADGWFITGDRAVVETDGCVTITGRTKDIIIRGGENIPVAAVESLIFRHPSVTDVAVVGYRDERLGERACAFVSLTAGAKLDLTELSAFLLDAGLSKRYLPEKLMVITDMPKTMSGKIRKVELRERLRKDTEHA
ncbi:AMP-binding protein [Nocardia sp. CA-107356]|uniref:AMP-binding protein n=1 Tax=Nocardia sp. CA-107356 TaxID=3239972 RepID=UPI003D950475